MKLPHLQILVVFSICLTVALNALHGWSPQGEVFRGSGAQWRMFKVRPDSLEEQLKIESEEMRDLAMDAVYFQTKLTK